MQRKIAIFKNSSDFRNKKYDKTPFPKLPEINSKKLGVVSEQVCKNHEETLANFVK